MRLEDIRLGFITSRSAHRGDRLWTDAGVGRLLEALARTCGRLTVAQSHSPVRQPFHDHPLDLPADDVLHLPWLPSTMGGFHKVAGCRRVIREVERRSDVVVVQCPFEAPLALLRPRRPRVYHLVNNIWTIACKSKAYQGVKRLPAMVAGGAIDSIFRGLIRSRQARVVANGRELLAHYGNPPGRGVVSTTIFEREIMSVASQRAAGSPFRVLFVGHMRHTKGIDILFDAYEMVLDELPDAELVIVGPPDVVDRGMTMLIDRRLAEVSQKGHVTRMGHKNFGPELFQCYADADVLAVPSRSEGTPRVLIEARSFGCPVIATRVDGTPTSIDDGVDGLMIPPEDPVALKEAILRIARDPELRERLVAGGIERARRSTMESFARVIAEEAEKLVVDVPVG